MEMNFEYERQLRILTNAFFSIANKAGIETLEQKIYDTFLDNKPGKSKVKAQLKNWVETPAGGRHEQAYPDAVALWNFLFPEAPRPIPLRNRKT